MKSLLFALVLFFGVGLANASDITQIKNDLKQVHYEFQELAVDLPFERIYYSWREKIREQYKEASRTLLQAIIECDRNKNEALKLTQNTLKSFREIGLIMPFDEIDKDKIVEVISRYLKAEDMLRNVTVSLTTTQPIPTADLWHYKGAVWKLSSQKMGVKEASNHCASISEVNSDNWRLPSLRELAEIFRDMKNPLINEAFGKTAQENFEEVWTADQRYPEDVYYFIHFREERSGTAPTLSNFTVVCIGNDLS